MSTFRELLALLPANDNGRFRVALAAPKPEDVARLVALAGYDPARIPAADLHAALHVIWCLEKGVFTTGEIARFIGADASRVRTLVGRVTAAASHPVREGRGRNGARKHSRGAYEHE